MVRGRNMKQEIALDIRRYQTEERFSSLPQDTASLAIEASLNSEIPRVNVTFLIKNRKKEKVIVPGKDKRDVRKMFTEDDISSKAGNIIVDSLIKDEDDFVYFWISPSGPYPEARIEAGAKKTTPSGRADFIKRYDISTKAPRQQCLALGQLLASMVQEKIDFPQNPDQLREMIFKLKIPEGKDPFKYIVDLLYDHIPEKHYLKNIIDGVVDRNKARILKTAHGIIREHSANYNYVISNPIWYGAYLETRMKQEGYGINFTTSGCGGSNESLMTSETEGVEKYAGVTSQIETQSKYVKKCGNCGAIIEGYISSGYICPHCGGMYKGC